ncbi:hypothetical protein CCP2SC5_800001 [Azospirillaceae bacterium]
MSDKIRLCSLSEDATNLSERYRVHHLTGRGAGFVAAFQSPQGREQYMTLAGLTHVGDNHSAQSTFAM